MGILTMGYYIDIKIIIHTYSIIGITTKLLACILVILLFNNQVWYRWDLNSTCDTVFLKNMLTIPFWRRLVLLHTRSNPRSLHENKGFPWWHHGWRITTLWTIRLTVQRFTMIHWRYTPRCFTGHVTRLVVIRRDNISARSNMASCHWYPSWNRSPHGNL